MMATVRRIAVLRALFLGDLLCATPALRAVRRRFPGAEITLIGLPWARESVDRLPSVDRFLEFPGYPGIAEVPVDEARTAAFLAEARETGYDLAIQMHGDGNISNGFAVALGARVTLGYRRGPDARLDLSLPWEHEEHETRRWTRLVGQVGAVPDGDHLDLPLLPSDEARAMALLVRPARLTLSRFGPLVGLHPGAKEGARRWPAERFAALGDQLATRHGARIVLTGGAGERALTAAVRAAMRTPALDLAGRTDLGTFAAVIKGLDLLVTNDTGASHVAAAMRTPSVVLFGPSRPAQWAPLDSRHRPIDALAHAAADRHPATALARLPLDPVVAACDAALAGSSRQSSVVSRQRGERRIAAYGPRPTAHGPWPTDDRRLTTDD